MLFPPGVIGVHHLLFFRRVQVLGRFLRHGVQLSPQVGDHAHLAAAQGDEDAISQRFIAAGLMTPDQVVEAQRLAQEWKPKPGR